MTMKSLSNEWSGGQAPVMLGIHSWSGRVPAPGEYVMSYSQHARTAYQVIAFYPTRPGSKSVGRIKCWRRRKADVPDGAKIHWWQWSKR